MGTRHLYWILTGPSFAVWVTVFSPVMKGFYKNLHSLLSPSVTYSFKAIVRGGGEGEEGRGKICVSSRRESVQSSE
jgi:hypothetical protein